MLDTRYVLADNLRVLEGISIGDLAVAGLGAHVDHELALMKKATAPNAKPGFAMNSKPHIKPAPVRTAVMRRRL